METAWRLAAEAVDGDAQLIVLPEYFNVMGLDREDILRCARTATEVDLHTAWVRNRCSGASPEPVRDFLLEDRRPDLYWLLVDETHDR